MSITATARHERWLEGRDRDRGRKLEAIRARHTPAPEDHRCRCSLPGLTGFTAFRREGTDTDYH